MDNFIPSAARAARTCLPAVRVSAAADLIADCGAVGVAAGEDGAVVGAAGAGVIPDSAGDGDLAGADGELGVPSGTGRRIGITRGGLTTILRTTLIHLRIG